MPDACHNIFGLFADERLFVEDALLAVQEKLQPPFVVFVFEQGRALAYKPFSNTLEIETKIFRHRVTAHDVIAFLLNLHVSRRSQISRRLRADPAILKGVARVDSRALPLLTRLQDASLQGWIYVMKAHCAEVDIFNDQSPAMLEISTHSSKRICWIGKILANIRAKNNVGAAPASRQLFQHTLFVLHLVLIPLALTALLRRDKRRRRNINAHNTAL